MARGFSRSGGGGGRSGGSGGGFSFGGSRSSSSSRSSSFGGWSSRSSSSRSYSSSYSGSDYHRPRRPRGPWRIPMFGRTVVVSTGARTAFSFLIFVFAIACFLCVNFGRFTSGYASNIKEQKLIVAEYETRDKDYKKLIQGATDGTYEIQDFDINQFYNEGTQKFTYRYFSGSYDPTTPGIYDMNFYRNGQEYFFIVYEYEYGGSTYTDWTFAQYSKYQLEDIKKSGGILKIAVGNLTGTASNDDGVWAMNMDYTLEANQEYQYEVYMLDSYKASHTKYLLVTIGCALVMAGILAGVVLYLVKKYKAAKVQQDLENQKTEAEIAEAQAKAEVAEKLASQTSRVCEYCGNSVPDGEAKCPACGSSRFES